MKEVKLFLGPQHPGMHGNYSVHMYVDGDMINKARPTPGFLHRGFEKVMERRLWMGNLALIPRICVVEPDINEMVYAMGIEALSGIEVPERAHWIRMMVLELGRLAIHMMGLGGIGGPTGMYTATYWGIAQRDLILDLFEKLTGARIYHMYIVPGGVRKDLPENFLEDVLKVVDDLEKKLPEFEQLILKHPIIHARIKDNIMLPAEVVWELGVTGIGMRSATGVQNDLRKVKPYARYDQVEFDVPTGTYSDGLSRMNIKYAEMFQSIRIIRQIIEKMPKSGPVRAKMSTGSALRWTVPAGMVYTAVESSRGEYGYFIVSDGGEYPYRIAVRGASFAQGLLGIEKYLPGHRIDDASLWMDTMGVCSPEIDR
ncbi:MULTISPECIES: NADH-quinone oxidoreductase subunit D [unclassified Fusibacter]|uniref:NADH-quinone oxidoreductase subunit D n=1 Tax=unclassified Fusibacter TaxID=2624464 RepID=UPI0010137A5D|nr:MULTISPECIES: NADH-quinone oxidoreductase subunit D [unclassified Fusibacter]MCK8060053.1 NADH-quinone oxidoreductase subunit D [Fusibacter sp. A2]NPE22195.1 NADH-quinone oxidoreductase subunit D [Fusibacter sp. A1]RXV60971.1 NADH-quinone oxidoreductase subunit D [Fusibacter sp. A1]